MVSRYLLTLFLLYLSSPLASQVYSCDGPTGTVYSQQPCDEQGMDKFVREQLEISESLEVKTWDFNDRAVKLEIYGGMLSIESANAALRSVGLPPVNEEGLNVEKYWNHGNRIGAGRLYRTDYRWSNYSLGPLTFERQPYGCKSNVSNEKFNCLSKIILGPTSIDRNNTKRK